MAEAVKKEEEKKEEKKKGPLGKLKEFSEDKEEQMEIFSTFVRLGILVWMEMLIAKAATTAPAQTIRLEQAPMVLAPSPTPPKK